MSSDFKKLLESAQIIPPHTHPLSLDSGNSVQAFIKAAAKDFNKKKIAVTDHGTIGAIIEAIDYSKALKKKEDLDITIIPGVELYLLPDADDDSGWQYYHLTVHFDDYNTYLDFCKLSKTAYDRSVWKGGELKPLTTWEELQSVAGRVTLFSGCLLSPCNRPILKGRRDIAERNFQRIQQIAGPGRFFCEIFPYEVSKNWNGKTQTFEQIKGDECCPSGQLQIEANNWIHYLANKYSVPEVISEDAHYAHEKDKIIQDMRLNQGNKGSWKMSDANCLHTNEWLFNEMKRLHPDWINEKSFLEMADNSLKFADNFKGFEPTFRHRLPAVELELNKELSYDHQLIDATMRLVREKNKIDLNNSVYSDRLIHEVTQVALNGKINILPYFLFLNKVVDWCSKNDVLVGPGRGSASGSLLTYALGITQVDPIKHGLSFERFFDVSRVAEGLADIDMDFSDRNKVVDWLKNEYGDKFAYLGIAGTFKTKSLLKDFDRFLYGEVRKETLDVCKTISTSPQGVSESDYVYGYIDEDGKEHPGLLDTNQDLVDYLDKNSTVKEYFTTAIGMVRQMGRHAAGILISDEPIHNFIPVTKVSGEPTTQLLPKYVEKAGGVKYDILGISTLEDIRLCINHIKERRGISIDPWKLEDNPEVWESIIDDPETVFQLHTETVRPGLLGMMPRSIEEGSALTSVFRPGAMDAPSDEYPGMMMSDVFVKRWRKELPVKYIHPDLEKYLGSTVGTVVYQEQAMSIAHELGNLSMQDTQKLRKAISKKMGDDLIFLLNKMKSGLISRGWTEQQADALKDQMVAAGKYSFNKSHGISYTYIAYACGWLKKNYPIEWWTSVLSNASKDDLRKYWHSMSDIILPPDINLSTDKFQIIKTPNGDKILSPLSIIEGIGTAVYKEILEKRPFTSLDDMIEKCERKKINKGVFTRLIFSGILNPFFTSNEPFEADKVNLMLQRRHELLGIKRESVPKLLIGMTDLQRSLLKKTVFKVYNEDIKDIAIPVLLERKIIKRAHPDIPVYVYLDLNDRRYPEKVLCGLRHYDEILDSPSEHNFAIIGYVTETKDHVYANGKKTMLKVSVDVEERNLNLVKFPPWKEDHHGVKSDLEETICIIVMNKRAGQEEAFIKDIYPLETTEFLRDKEEEKKNGRSKKTKKST